MNKRRVFLVVIDSVGVGGAHDAAEYFNGDKSDEGSNTIAHIAEAVRNVAPLKLPVLARLGLGVAVKNASGIDLPELQAPMIGLAGAAIEHSKGKDTPSGHWEISGVPVPWDWHYFPNEIPCFQVKLLDAIKAKTGIEFIGNKHASGTAIVDELGDEHIRSGKPIAYSSVDSVFQIAAHEAHFGLERLYKLCQDVAELVHPMRVGRVIARPFIGEDGNFTRTSNRHDYAIEPPELTILDRAYKAGHKTVAIGKIRDIFSGRGIDEAHYGKPDDALFDDLDREIKNAPDGALVFANLVEFDTQYGHRRDPEGYARHLEWFDRRLGRALGNLRKDDLLIITADHGNDPTWHGTDHTRERAPVLAYSPALEPRDLGLVDFSDIGASVLEYLDVAPDIAPDIVLGLHGKSFL